jgi:hypothetical protein
MGKRVKEIMKRMFKGKPVNTRFLPAVIAEFPFKAVPAVFTDHFS